MNMSPSKGYTPAVPKEDVLSVLKEYENNFVTVNFIVDRLIKKKPRYDTPKISEWYLSIKVRKNLDILSKEDEIETIELLHSGLSGRYRIHKLENKRSPYVGYRLKKK